MFHCLRLRTASSLRGSYLLFDAETPTFLQLPLTKLADRAYARHHSFSLEAFSLQRASSLFLLRGRSQEQSYPCMLMSMPNMPISHQDITAHAENPELDALLLISYKTSLSVMLQGAPHLPAEHRHQSLCSVAHTLPPLMPPELHERGIVTSLFPVFICPDPPSFQQQQHLPNRKFPDAPAGRYRCNETQQPPVPDSQRGVET